MCAIFGSRNIDKFKILYNLNLVRGRFAYGGVYLKKDSHTVVKVPKISDIDINYDTDINYYTGHTQAPTSSAQTYNLDTSHPFIFDNWIVSHNGVLTNYKQLINKFNIKIDTTSVVDSSVIPRLLFLAAKTGNDSEIDQLVNTLSLLEGTHSTTIYNSATKNLYITRCGSTLYKDNYGNYSSIYFDGSDPIQDGAIYRYDDNTFREVGIFASKSPFFI